LRSLPPVQKIHMPIFRILFLLFLCIPLIEIYLLIQVGEIIGALPTIFMVVFTAVLGVALLRWQGLVTLTRMQAAMARGELPAVTMIEGVFLLVAGALLLTPGFFTDAIGFALLIPPPASGAGAKPATARDVSGRRRLSPRWFFRWKHLRRPAWRNKRPQGYRGGIRAPR